MKSTPTPTLTHTLPLMESFLSIQGEGFHQGKASWFIRLAGCDVGCHWCDVKESWDASQYPLINISDLVDQADSQKTDTVIITGGEPLMYDLTPLTMSLKERGLIVHLETSGAYPVTGSWDWICFSPKKFKKPLPEFYEKAHELKIIVHNRSDFEWAQQHAALVSPDCKLFLQPEWDRLEKVTPLMVDFVTKHPEWRISLQIHKYMDLP